MTTGQTVNNMIKRNKTTNYGLQSIVQNDNDRVACTPLNSRAEHRCFGRVRDEIPVPLDAPVALFVLQMW